MDITVLLAHSTTHIQVLNTCQLYLGVTLLSDITMANGGGLAPFAFVGQKSSFSKVNGLLPYQDHPITKPGTSGRVFWPVPAPLDHTN